MPMNDGEEPASVAKKAGVLFDKSGFKKIIEDDAMVAVKQHFGERGNDDYLPPAIAAEIVRRLQKCGAKPFLTDTNTLYSGSRHNAVDHLATIHEHGFTTEAVGAPVLIADGLRGADHVEVGIEGKHMDKVYLASAAAQADALVVLTHVTGHCNAGLGGTIKNVAMGFASRAGKLAQHHVGAVLISKDKCAGCGICADVCPEGAITVDDVASVDAELCIGCGQCLALCPKGAIGHAWGRGAQELQERMAEYVLALMNLKRGRVAFMSFLYHVRKDCDCIGRSAPKYCRDLGILSSLDPVALDQATIDIVEKELERPGIQEMWPDIDPTIQIRHAEKIGAGTAKYNLKDV